MHQDVIPFAVGYETVGIGPQRAVGTPCQSRFGKDIYHTLWAFSGYLIYRPAIGVTELPPTGCF